MSESTACDLFTCCVCRDDFATEAPAYPAPDLRPVCLPCGHNVCRRCSKEIIHRGVGCPLRCVWPYLVCETTFPLAYHFMQSIGAARRELARQRSRRDSSCAESRACLGDERSGDKPPLGAVVELAEGSKGKREVVIRLTPEAVKAVHEVVRGAPIASKASSRGASWSEQPPAANDSGARAGTDTSASNGVNGGGGSGVPMATDVTAAEPPPHSAEGRLLHALRSNPVIAALPKGARAAGVLNGVACGVLSLLYGRARSASAEPLPVGNAESSIVARLARTKGTKHAKHVSHWNAELELVLSDQRKDLAAALAHVNVISDVDEGAFSAGANTMPQRRATKRTRDQ